MTDTPRTESMQGHRLVAHVPVLFARTLERELNAANAEIDRLRADLVAARGCLSAVEEIAERYGDINKSLIAERDALAAEVAALKAERDEAFKSAINAALRADDHKSDPLAEMWAALAEYQPMADRNGHGKSWKRMCEERTEAAASSAGSASRPAGEAWEAASWAASAASWTAMNEAGDAARAAARSIDAIRRAKEAQR